MPNQSWKFHRVERRSSRKLFAMGIWPTAESPSTRLSATLDEGLAHLPVDTQRQIAMNKVARELGRKKLMMKLPTLRKALAVASGEAIDQLFIAYQLSVSTRDRIRSQEGAPTEWHSEYDKIFEELEDDVRRYFANQILQ